MIGYDRVVNETRWLSDDEQQTWRAFLWASQLLRESLERQLQRDARMPHAYYMILAMLSEAPGRTMSMTDLAEVTRSSASRLSHAVAKLESQSWVTRDKHPENGRITLTTLTDQGFAELVATAPGHVEQVRAALFDRLTPAQVEQLRQISLTVLAGLAPDRAC
jgi:DNA-binding MarR family transcriptional regulator